MILESEIRNKLAAVSAGVLPVWDFYDWLEDASEKMLFDGSAEGAVKLVLGIDHIFAEHDRQIFDREGLLKRLSTFVQPVMHEVKSRSESRFVVYELQWGDAAKRGSWVGSSSVAPQKVSVLA